MSAHQVNCPMCGHSFDPEEHVACRACPLQKGCQLVCCPSCGYELVDVRKSTLAKWVAGWLFPDRAKASQPASTKTEARNK